MKQQARNVLMWPEDNELAARFLIHDRDTKFAFGFDRVFANAGIRRGLSGILAPRSWIRAAFHARPSRVGRLGGS